MDRVSIAEREIAAFMKGVEEELLEIRGYGLSADERADYELEAAAIYGVSEKVVEAA